MKKRKVAVVVHSLQHGGLARSLITALSVIDMTKFDITLFLLNETDTLRHLIPPQVRIIINDDKTHHYRRPMALLYQLLIKLFSFNKLIKDKYKEKLHSYVHARKAKYCADTINKSGEYDVAVGYTVDMCAEVGLLINASKHYVFYHSSDPMFHRDITEKVFPYYDKIIAVGKSVETMLRETFSRYNEKIHLIANYSDFNCIKEFSSQSVPENKRLRRDTDIVLSTCGRIDREKGYDLALGAAKMLRESGVSFGWYFIGDGGSREKIEKMRDEYNLSDYVYITGFEENPYRYINLCDIYVQPSYEESFGLTIVEAMIAGKPVVSTATLGARDILENGKRGVLTDINAEELYNGIMSLISDTALRGSFCDIYTPEENIKEKEEYSRLWNSLLDED